MPGRVELRAFKASLLPRFSVKHLVLSAGYHSGNVQSTGFEASAFIVPECVNDFLRKEFAADAGPTRIRSLRSTSFTRTVHPSRTLTQVLWEKRGSDQALVAHHPGQHTQDGGSCNPRRPHFVCLEGKGGGSARVLLCKAHHGRGVFSTQHGRLLECFQTSGCSDLSPEQCRVNLPTLPSTEVPLGFLYSGQSRS